MDRGHSVGRRDFLRFSAIAAGSAALAACGGGGGGNTTAETPSARNAPTAPAGSPPTAADAAAPAPTDAPNVGRATQIPAAGLEFKEAPSLAALVQQGKLPPVGERLPKNPYVVPHKWLKIGKYGGQIQTACSDTWGTAHFLQESMYGRSPLRWLRDGLKIGPGLVEEWESNDDTSEWTLHFREGLK